jgi:hypothetical protein
MRLFSRKKKWQRVVGKMTSNAAKKSAVKTGAAALTGAVTAVAASAAVSAARRKSES